MTTTHDLIAKLRKSARTAHDATNRAQREAAQAFLVKRADELRERRDALAAKLWQRWDWHDANEDHPEHPRRELKTIDLLHEYEEICDALEDALAIWLAGESTAPDMEAA